MNSKFFRRMTKGIALLCFSLSAAAQPVLLPTDTISGDDVSTPGIFASAYGVDFDTWKDWVAVGAPRERATRNGFDVADGVVYLYQRDSAGNFVVQQKILAPGNSDLAAPFGDRFGAGVAIENGWLFIAAANSQDFGSQTDPRGEAGQPDFRFAGQVFVYRLNRRTGSWDFRQILSAPVPKSSGAFGARSQASHIALQSNGRVAVIGEANNFTDGVGEAHVYRLRRGRWTLVQTIPAPEGFDEFGDDLVFVEAVDDDDDSDSDSDSDDDSSGRDGSTYVLIGGGIFSDDLTVFQGSLALYRQKRNGRFETTPAQLIFGSVYETLQCSRAGFGANGMDASAGVVAIADPCFNGEAGALTGAVQVYERVSGPSPLAQSAFIELDMSLLVGGANFFGSRYAVALNSTGTGLLVGTSLSPLDDLNLQQPGDDVRYFTFDSATDEWSLEALLASDVPDVAPVRAFGDTVFFADDGTAVIRTNNSLEDPSAGLKSKIDLFDLPAAEDPEDDDSSSDDDSDSDSDDDSDSD